MKTLIETFKASLSKSNIYTNPENNRVGDAVKYILRISLAIGVIFVVYLFIVFLPALKEIKTFGIETLSEYPSDLVLTLADGKLSMNKPSPYSIATPESSQGKYKNIVVIDINANLDVGTFESYDTYALLTRDGYMAIDENRKIQAQSFKELPDYVLSKEKVDSFRSKIENFNVWMLALVAALGAVVLSAFVALGLFASTLFLSIFGALVAWIVLTIKGYRLPYAHAYALALYAWTAILVLKLVDLFINMPPIVYPIVFILILVLFVSPKTKAEMPVGA